MAGRTKKGDFPEIKKANQGKFTSWAKRNGFSDACSAANAVTLKCNKCATSYPNWIVATL